MKEFKIIKLLVLIILSNNIYSHEENNELVIIKNTELRESPANNGKLIYKLYPTITIKNKLDSNNKNSGWTKVDSGLCTLKKKHDECNSAIGYIPSDALLVFDRKLFKEFHLKKQIKFKNFNSEPELNYVFEEDGSFYHYDPICGNGEGKCGKSKLYRIHNLIWGEPIAGDFIYKFFINDKGQICAPYPGKSNLYPCSKESINNQNE